MLTPNLLLPRRSPLGVLRGGPSSAVSPTPAVITAGVNDCGGGGGDCGDDLVVVVNATNAYLPSPLLRHRNRRLRMKAVLAGSVKSPANTTFVVRAAIAAAAAAAVLRENLVLVATAVVMMAEPVDGLSLAIAAPAAARHWVRADSWRMRRRRQRCEWRRRWGGQTWWWLRGEHGCVVMGVV